MGDSRFDLWTRRRFGQLAGGFFGALIGPTTPQESEGKKRRRKKRKKVRATDPPAQTFRDLREACSSAADEQCHDSLVCEGNGCTEVPLCLQTAGGLCRDGCDCRPGLECSERAGKTCQRCSLPQLPCESPDDCCLSTSFCATNACYDPQYTYCCQGLGARCSAPCDCCPNPGQCGLNGCGGVETVCCRGQGFPCESNCDCCNPLQCQNSTCQ